jgi:cytoskeletal protein CcmA (bactofilin family)
VGPFSLSSPGGPYWAFPEVAGIAFQLAAEGMVRPRFAGGRRIRRKYSNRCEGATMCGWRLGWLVGSLAAAGCLLPRLSIAAEIRGGEEIVVKKEETVADDLYCFGRLITIDGTVEGDVVAFGEQITINGVVQGDVMAAGQTVVIMGQAEGARVAGQVLKLGEKAKLEGDVLAAGLSLECAKDSEVDGDALFAGYQALFAGHVASDVRGGMAKCRIAGTVDGDVLLEVGSDKDAPPASTFGPAPPVAMPNVPGGLTLAGGAVVEGDLSYSAPQEAKVDPAATVQGEIKYQRPQPKPAGKQAPARNAMLVKAVERLRHVLSVLLVGIVAILVLPRATETWAQTILQRPGMTLVSGILGLLAFIALLVVAAIVIVATAILLGVATLGELVPMVVVGGIVSYAALIVGFWIVAAFLAEALTGLALGRLAIRGSGIGTGIVAMAMGVVVLAALLSIPYVAGIVGFLVVILALGSICLWLVGQTPPQSFAVLPPAKPIPATMV